MTWLQRHRARHYLKNSLWIWPVASIVAALVAVFLLQRFEFASSSPGSPDAARAVLGTLAASMFTFVVFVSSALLVAVQLASSQLTPRVIATVFRDPITKGSLVVFVFTFTFSLAVMVRTTTAVPVFLAQVAAYSCLASLGVFLYLVDHVGKALRPSGALWAVAREGRAVIASVYPRLLEDSPAPLREMAELGSHARRIIASPKDGVILAFDISGLVSLATRAHCIIELVPQVGDFIAMGDPLFRIYDGGDQLPARALCQSVAVSRERTLEQDPAFAFRILVDIASKGLSPAINDPTTAVLAIDQIHHLLRDVGRRRLDDERVLDRSGTVRLIYRTPDWADFVHLAVTEIRHFGGGSIQVARRLRAMLKNLIQTLPPPRATLLHQELQLLHRSAQRFFSDSEDLALADVSDLQGVGGTASRPSVDSPALESAPS